MDYDFWVKENVERKKVDVIQINLGNRCHLKCEHCHVDASPDGKNSMDRETSKRIILKILEMENVEVEFTGGTPEMNENLEFFIEELGKRGRKLAVRSGITLLSKEHYRKFIDLYKKYGVKVIASLPALYEESTDRQRGEGAFRETVNVLKLLNENGFGTGDGELELVYNPSGEYLPASQKKIEEQYREVLRERYSIEFNSLIAIINTPVKRYREHLEKEGKLNWYMSLLKNNYNETTVPELMCRSFISVDFEGYIYDCDFNQALGMRIKGYETRKFWEVDFASFAPEISFDDHCYACTAGEGSSCHGALTKEIKKPLLNNLTIKEVIRPEDVKLQVQNYYGKEILQTSDLKTSACCTADSVPDRVKRALSYVPDEVQAKYYGCGSPFPEVVEGMKILDLGSGTGRDVYTLSYLVGEKGKVFGIDMTEEQTSIAEKYVSEHAGSLGYKEPNVKFIHDYIENIDNHFEENSIDIVISNCVVNLLENKEEILQKVFKILKNGGEFYFSDVYADRRVPEKLRKDPVLYGECLSGALYHGDFKRYAKGAGFEDPRVVSKSDIDVEDAEIATKTGNIKFCSITYRLWKIDGLEDQCEDYGHIAIYKGGIDESLHMFGLDDEHFFEKGRPERVCGNTALMLSETRYGEFFDVIGSFEEHFGEYTVCGTMVQPAKKPEKESSCGC